MKQETNTQLQTFDMNMLRKNLKSLDADSMHVAYTEEFGLGNDLNLMKLPSTPIRLKTAVFGLCLNDEGDIEVDSQTIKIKKNRYIVLHPNQVVKFEKGHFEHSKVIFVCVSNKMYEETLQSMRDLLPLFFYIRQNPCAELPEKEVAWIKTYHNQILKELQRTDNIFRRQTARALITAMLYKVCDIYGKLVVNHEPQTRKDDVFRKFLKLLNENFLEHKNVAWYAEQLFITPKYMSMVIKDVSGQTANDWIQSCVVQEAKRLLKNSNMNVQQIALTLQFPSQSFFGKFFKNVTGMSPSQYRNKK